MTPAAFFAQALEAGPHDISVREYLRRSTNDIHEALHRARPFAAIAARTATRENYAGTLQFLHRYHGAMAPFCTQAAQALDASRLAQAHQDRIAALETDIAFLGHGHRLAPIPDPSAAPDFCIGALYTVQGSTLGGKWIHRQLDFLLPDDNGRTFFKGTAEDSRDWRLLCEKLESRGAALDALHAGAHHAFAQFQAMLD